MSIPYREWTDDEWLRLINEFPPDTSVDVAEAKVAEWRQQA